MREPSFRAIRWILAALAALAAVGIGGTAHADSLKEQRHSLDHRLTDTKERIAEAQGREQTLADEVRAASDRIDAVEADLAGLSAELAGFERRLEAARTRLLGLQTRWEEKTAQLILARKQLAVAQRRLEQRVVDVYTGGESHPLAVVLGAESLVELVDQLEAQTALLDHDTSLVRAVTSLRARVAAERKQVASLRSRQERQTAALAREADARRAAVARLAGQRRSLDDLRAARTRSLASVRVTRRQWEDEAAALEAESARVASIIASVPPPPAASSSAPSAPASEGAAGVQPPAPPPAPSQGLAWPVRGTVVSPFGQRWGRLHAGIDIAAPAGTPIAAAASGRVIYAGSMSGYGTIVIVQHADGIATAYAHNSANYVSVGQTVTRGQRIAAVGCTGRCYGDHVHFEVRVNSSPVDPMGHL